MKRFSIVSSVFIVVVISMSPKPLLSQGAPAEADQLSRLQRQLADMKGQIDAIQAQINDLSHHSNEGGGNERSDGTSDAGATTPNVDVPPSPDSPNQRTQDDLGASTATHATYAQDPIAAPRINNEPLDPRYPGYFRLPGTQTFLRIGGYFKTDFIRDIRQAGDTESFIPSSIPVPTATGLTNSTVSVRPTRLNLDFLVPSDQFGKIRFFVEGDLFGSSATTPRLRHAYAQGRNFLVGQTFSGFMDPDAGPDQLDFQGPNGQVSTRNPQLRYSVPLATRTFLSFSIEKASSDVAVSTPEFEALPNNPAPDGTIHLRHEMNSGHVQLSAIFRDVAASLPNGVADSTFGWGLNLAGSQKALGNDTVVYQFAYGHGIARYVNDTAGLGIDAAPISSQHPSLKAIPVFATYGAYQHYWTTTIRSSIIYGFAQVDNTELQPDSTFHKSDYSAANIIWNAYSSLNVGAEVLYGWVVKKDGSSGNAPRLMLSAKYNFVKGGDSPKSK